MQHANEIRFLLDPMPQSLDSESVAAVPSEWLLSQGGSVSTTPSESSRYGHNWTDGT